MPDWKRTFYAIFVAETLATIGFNAVMPIIPFFIRDLGVSEPARLNLWVGACATVPAICMFLFAPLWGQLADSYGKRLMFLRSLVGGVVVTALLVIANRPWQVLALRGLAGALTGTISAATVLVAMVSPTAQLGYTLGMLQTGVYAGASLGPAFGGLLLDLFGYKVTFIVTSVVVLIAALIVVGFVKNDPKTPAHGGSFLRSVIPDFSPLVRSHGLLVLVLISGGLQVASSTVAPILPLFIQSISGPAAKVGSMTGLIFGASALAAALCSAGLGRFSHRIGYERLLVFCLTGAVFVFLLQAFVRNPIQLLVLRALGGAMIGGSEPSINAMIALRADKSRQGVVYGLNSSMNSAGAAAGPMIGALLSAAFGFASAFFAGAAVLLVSVIGASVVKSSMRRPS